jgi:RNA polymerase sigma-70 factor (ECF subfamily)
LAAPVTRNEIRKMAERKSRQAIGSGDTQMHGFLEQTEESNSSETEWDHEYHWNAFLWAAERVKPEFRENTWQAFWRTVVAGEESSQVAKDLKNSLGAVYIARSRVTARIKQELEVTLDE